MRSFKNNLLVGASALLAAAASIAPASAATINGGGSSLIAPYIAQAFDCHVGLVTAQAKLFNSAGGAQTIATPSGTCATGNTDNFAYLTSGSGAGLRGLFSGNAENLQSNVPGSTGSFSVSTLTGITSVQFAAADAALTGADVTVYNTTTPVTYQGATFTPVSGVGTGRGALIQAPLSIDPVAITFNPKYDSTHSLNINTGDSKLHLNRTAICKIFNNEITDWNDAALTTLNGGTPLTPTDLTHPNGLSLPIVLVGRSDSSGTTSIFYRHLANVCTGVASTNHYTNTAGATLLPSGVTFTTVSGSGAVASTVNSTFGSIAYIGPDYVLPAVLNTGANAFNLPAADLQNNTDTAFYQPNAVNALTAFANIAPPQSDSNGNFNSDPGTDRTVQTQWAPVTGTGIENPIAGYPMLGTTNILLYTTGYSAGEITALTDSSSGFLTWYYDPANSDVNNTSTGILAKAGLAPVPDQWKVAITEAFNTGLDGLGLQIQ